MSLYPQKREAISVIGSRGEYGNPREFLIPFKEIELAMRTSKKSSLPPHYYSDLYTAELSERWPNCTVVFKSYNDNLNREMFYNELNIVSRFHHENIIPYIGYCDEGGKNILIYEHATNGCLRDHLQVQDKLRCIPWEQRLKICLGAASGLKCLHSGLWDENRIVVHRHVKSECILLDENMEAKISEFGSSIFVPRNKPQVSDKNWELACSDIIDDVKAFMDPIYKQSYIVNTEVDVYSFGCVMFEILSGLTTVSGRTDICNEEADLIKRVHRHYGYNEIDKLIDPNIRDQIDGRSLQTFAETAYRCLSYNIKERPSMKKIIKKIEEAIYFQNQILVYLVNSILSKDLEGKRHQGRWKKIMHDQNQREVADSNRLQSTLEGEEEHESIEGTNVNTKRYWWDKTSLKTTKGKEGRR
ncbi:protein kinase, ATP binding site-containing protein [Tanacetum coccineum]